MSDIILREGFEAGLPTLEAGEWHTSGNPAGPNYALTQESARAGSNALRVSLAKTDTSGFRSEWRLRRHGEEINTPSLVWGDTYWFTVSIYLPPNFVPDPGASMIVFQIHAASSLGLAPPIKLQILTTGKWRLEALGASAPLTAWMDADDIGVWALHDAVAGMWHDWAFRFRFDVSPVGEMLAYYNRTLVANYTGKLGYEEVDGPYIKFGVYIPSWPDAGSLDDMTMLFDSISLTRGAAGFTASSPPSPYPGQPRIAIG